MAILVPPQRSLWDGLYVEEGQSLKSIHPLLLPEDLLGSSLRSLSRQGFHGNGKGTLVRTPRLVNRGEGAAEHSSCPPTPHHTLPNSSHSSILLIFVGVWR